MPRRLLVLAVPALLLLLAGCRIREVPAPVPVPPPAVVPAPAQPPAPPAAPPASVVLKDARRLIVRARAAVADPLRPQEDRVRDRDRRPADVVAFFGIDEGMKVADLQAATGYFTEILSSVVGPKGRVIAQNNEFVLKRFAGKPLAERLETLRRAGRTNVERLDAELDEMNLPPDLDAVLFIRFYHDLFWLPTRGGDKTDRKEFLRRVHAALKPGGVFGVIDHHARSGSGERDALDPDEGLHRIDVELVKSEVLAAGFVLETASDLLKRSEDTRDWIIFSEGRRDRTDQFVLRFRKPAS